MRIRSMIALAVLGALAMVALVLPASADDDDHSDHRRGGELDRSSLGSGGKIALQLLERGESQTLAEIYASENTGKKVERAMRRGLIVHCNPGGYDTLSFTCEGAMTPLETTVPETTTPPPTTPPSTPPSAPPSTPPTTSPTTPPTTPPTTIPPPTTPPSTPPETTTPEQTDPVFVGAGDIAGCDSSGDEATASLLDGIPGTVYTLGDNVYNSGTDAEFAECYDPSWGRHKARTKPIVGNHEYGTVGASGYFNYFGAAAGDPSEGYYSYDLGAWHIVALNSMCENVGGCGPGSPMLDWLEQDLAANPTSCTLALWHHPVFSSGSEHGSDPKMVPSWDVLYAAGADVVLSGHEHDYERFAPQTSSGVADLYQGIREFVVGTGGKSHYAIFNPIVNSEAHNDDTNGVLKLTLHATSYDWEFVPEAGMTFTDSGSSSCH
jgi:calcineurin-like phosphoesterase family protein